MPNVPPGPSSGAADGGFAGEVVVWVGRCPEDEVRELRSQVALEFARRGWSNSAEYRQASDGAYWLELKAYGDPAGRPEVGPLSYDLPPGDRRSQASSLVALLDRLVKLSGNGYSAAAARERRASPFWCAPI